MHLGMILNSKILKKGVQIGPKLKCEPGSQEGHSALLECQSKYEKCQSALPKCRLAQICGSSG